MRAGFTRGKSGVQTVYDVFAVAPPQPPGQEYWRTSHYPCR
jgi:hypothetical protein